MKKQRGVFAFILLLMIALMGFLYLVYKTNVEQCNKIGKVFIQGECK